MKCLECNQNEVPQYRKKYCDDCAKKKANDFANQGKVDTPVVETITEAPQAKKLSSHNAMYVSYAKDLFIASIATCKGGSMDEENCADVMRQCIALVQQAQEAFS